MKFVYLDKKDRVIAWIGSWQAWAFAAVVLVLLLVPFRRETVEGSFSLEPTSSAIIRAAVPGMVTAVHSNEGMTVLAGTPLFRLRNISLQSKAAETEANYAVASMGVSKASLRNENLGDALLERDRLSKRNDSDASIR
jgi:multidrug efflux pump subunit AcrA (membrane-fusion protein)